MAESKEYVKLWMSYDDYFCEYDDAAVGAIVRAMIAYRRDGTAPSFTGPEKFIWPAIRRDIDESIRAQTELSARRRESGQKGGATAASKGKQNQANEANAAFAKQNEQVLDGGSKSSYGQGQGQGQGQGDKARAKRFTPPTLAEVQSYVAERHSPVDPQEFIDFYASKGWMVGKTPMKDWKAACRNAEKWDRWSQNGTQCGEATQEDLDKYMRW